MLKISPQGINAIFANVFTDPENMVWVTNEDYSKEVYISPQVEDSLGISCQTMYQDWRNILKRLTDINPQNNYQEIVKKLGDRHEQNPYVVYCLDNKCYTKTFIKDTVLCKLKHKYSDKDLIMGMLKIITEQEYEDGLKDNKPAIKSPALEVIFKNISEIAIVDNKNLLDPDKDHKANPTTPSIFINNHEIPITHREAECLSLLLEGMSSKLIARKLKISPRTVEIHIMNIKHKAAVNSRIELLTKVQNAESFLQLTD